MKKYVLRKGRVQHRNRIKMKRNVEEFSNFTTSNSIYCIAFYILHISSLVLIINIEMNEYFAKIECNVIIIIYHNVEEFRIR